MSDKVPVNLDVDSLTEALNHLHLATDSLSRALASGETSPAGEWILVQDEAPRESPGLAKDPSPEPAAGSSDPPPRLRFRAPNPRPAGFFSAEDCVPLCISLPLASRADRARRAFLAGQSAALVLSGERACPDPTPSLSVRNRVYVVLRHHSGAPPAFYLSFSAFKRAVGHLPGTTTVCHGFPTEGEARCFCHGAACPFPPTQG